MLLPMVVMSTTQNIDNSAMEADHGLVHKHQQPLEYGAGFFAQHLCFCL